MTSSSPAYGSTTLAQRNVAPSAFRHFVANNSGLLLIGASEFFFAAMNTAVKILNSIDPPVSTYELILIRMIITYVCSIAYMTATGVPHPFIGPKGVRTLLLARGIGGSIGLYGIYYSLQYLSLSDATVLTFLAPTCTAISGAVLLGEHLRVSQLVAGVVSLGGVVLIARPPWLFEDSTSLPNEDGATPAQRMAAVGAALIGVLGATMAYTSLRAIGKRAHAMNSMVSFSGLSIIFSGGMMLATGTEFVIPTRWLWLSMLLVLGAFGFIAQILLTMGLQRETAGRGMIAVYTQIVFALILQRLCFGTTPPLLSFVGTFAIIASALYTALNKAKPAEAPLVATVDEERGLLDDSDDRR